MTSQTPLAVVSGEAFFDVEMRVGVVTDAKPFPEARKPAYQIWVDFGEGFGVRKTSAQITQLYTPESLIGRRVVGWVNAPQKQVGPFMSEFLLLGAHNAEGFVTLLDIERVPVGSRVC